MTDIQKLLLVYTDISFAASPSLFSQAQAQGVCNGLLVRENASQYLARRGTVQGRVVRIDCISPNLAYAQFRYNIPTGQRDEVVGMIRVESGWKVVSLLWGDNQDAFSNLYAGHPGQQAEDVRSLYEMLLHYCDAVYNLDAVDALSLFWPDTFMEHPTNGKEFAYVPITVLHQRWEGLDHPTKLGIPQFSRIYHAEMINGCTAIAKLGVSKLSDQYNDYLSCVKQDGRWVIVNKMTELLGQKNPPSVKG